MDREAVLAFRLGRHGLNRRTASTLTEAAACPASDFSRGSALIALAARCDDVTREAYDRAADSGELVVGPTLRAAIHALAPGDFALYGRALLAERDDELIEQLGPSLKRELPKAGIAPTEALDEVAHATEAALADGQALSKDELHAELRSRVRGRLLPWCEGCGSHHVAPMLWRFAGVRAGMRCDSHRRFLLDTPKGSPQPTEAARRFLHFYGPSSAKHFAAWAGLARAHARRIWADVADELVEVDVEGHRAKLLAEDEAQLDSPRSARGVRLLPPRDPYVQQPDRATIAPSPELRKRLFRPVAGPGAVLHDGRLAGLWRARERSRGRLEFDVEPFEAIDRDELEAEAYRVARTRGCEAADVRWG